MKTRCAQAIFLSSVLSACGGGGGGDSAAGGGSISGRVGDGYIEGAYVCHDSDADMDCLDESYSISAGDGSFSLSGFDPAQDLMVFIPAGATDHGPFVGGSTAAQSIVDPLWYYLPAGASDGTSEVFISPLSTLVQQQRALMPSMSLAQAHDAVLVNLGETKGGDSSLFDNFIDGAAQNNELQAMAQSVHLALAANISVAPAADSAQQKLWFASARVLDKLPQARAQLPADLTGFSAASLLPLMALNTSDYATQIAQLTPFLPYLSVPPDLCADLASGYFAFEGWDDNDNEYKKMYLADDGSGANHLNILSQQYNGSVMMPNDGNSTATAAYRNNVQGTLIDMAAVNHASDPYAKLQYDIPMPAAQLSCDGDSARFDANGFAYDLFVAGVDLSVVPPSLMSSIADRSSTLFSTPVSFSAGDTLYAAAMLKAGDSYVVYNGIRDGVAKPDGDFLTYKYSSGPPKGVLLSNSLVGSSLLNDDLVIEYTDDNYFKKLERVSATQVHVTLTENGVQEAAQSYAYSYEQHNGHAYLILEDYDGLNVDLFMGRVDAVDGNSMVWGLVYRDGAAGWVSHPGGMMDDLMVNQSAADKIIQSNSINP